MYPDLMHVKHLGVDLSLLGSALTWLLKHYLPGTTEENLTVIWDFIKGWFKEPLLALMYVGKLKSMCRVLIFGNLGNQT